MWTERNRVRCLRCVAQVSCHGSPGQLCARHGLLAVRSMARQRLAPRAGNGASVRVAIVSECFLPVVNGVTNSVLRVVEHLTAGGHDVLVIAPGMDAPTDYAGAPVVRIHAVGLPVVTSMPVGVPSRRVLKALREFAPDVVQ